MATRTATTTTSACEGEAAVPMRRLGVVSTATGIEGNTSDSGPASDEETQEYPTGLKFWLILLTMSALVTLGGLDTNIVATAVPRYVLENQCPL